MNKKQKDDANFQGIFIYFGWLLSNGNTDLIFIFAMQVKIKKVKVYICKSR